MSQVPKYCPPELRATLAKEGATELVVLRFGEFNNLEAIVFADAETFTRPHFELGDDGRPKRTVLTYRRTAELTGGRAVFTHVAG